MLDGTTFFNTQINTTYQRQPTWRSLSFVKTTSATAAAASVSVVIAEPEQSAPLAMASERIPVSGSPLSVEVRWEEDYGRERGRELWGDPESNGV